MKEVNVDIHACWDIGSFMSAKMKINDQEFWNQNAVAIDFLDDISAALGSETLRFQDEQKRANAISLIAVTGAVWSMLRSLAGVNGKDSDWLKSHLPHNGTDPFNLMLPHQEIISDVGWVFDANSFLRHPKNNLSDFSGLLWPPYSDEITERLIRAATQVCHILSSVRNDVSPLCGSTEERQKKTMLFETALKNESGHVS